MSNALKDGLVGHYPLQSNAVNMVGGVAGTINGTPSWRKNHAGKVVLDDTTAFISHGTLPVNTVTYWKDGHFYAVLNGVPYMIDESLSSSFTSCANATMIARGGLPNIEYDFIDANLYTSGSDTLLRNTGTGGAIYDVKAYNTTSGGSIIGKNLTYGSTTVPGWTGNNSNRYWKTLAPVTLLGAQPFVVEIIFERGRNGIYQVNVEMSICQGASTAPTFTDSWALYISYPQTVGGPQTGGMTISLNNKIYQRAYTTAPAIGVAGHAVGGMGIDRKPFITINGVSNIGATALTSFMSMTEYLTLGAFTDLTSILAGTVAANRGWIGMNKTTAQLAALAAAREDAVFAGTATRSWPELFS
jgi:hypothetical protein